MKSIPYNDYYESKLLSIPLFKDLPVNLKCEIIRKLHFKLYEIDKDTIIIEQGSTCCYLYILLEGILEVNIIDANGNEVLIEHIEAPRTLPLRICFKGTIVFLLRARP